VKKEANHSYMEMLSEGIPYRGDTIDVLVRVTVFSGIREAKVEAFAFSKHPVQFMTGVNYHQGTSTFEGSNFIGTWGLHPEDVAAFQLNIGSGIVYQPENFEQKIKSKTQFQLVSKPTKYISTWITSSCELEKQLNTKELFAAYLESLKL
jgi:hypothetical protein